jgi:hypothetical protein
MGDRSSWKTARPDGVTATRVSSGTTDVRFVPAEATAQTAQIARTGHVELTGRIVPIVQSVPADPAAPIVRNAARAPPTGSDPKLPIVTLGLAAKVRASPMRVAKRRHVRHRLLAG